MSYDSRSVRYRARVVFMTWAVKCSAYTVQWKAMTTRKYVHRMANHASHRFDCSYRLHNLLLISRSPSALPFALTNDKTRVSVWCYETIWRWVEWPYIAKYLYTFTSTVVWHSAYTFRFFFSSITWVTCLHTWRRGKKAGRCFKCIYVSNKIKKIAVMLLCNR